MDKISLRYGLSEMFGGLPVTQKIAVSNKVAKVMKKYNSKDEFLAANRTFNDFIKNNNYDCVVTHFNGPMTEVEYNQIVDEVALEKFRTKQVENVETNEQVKQTGGRQKVFTPAFNI